MTTERAEAIARAVLYEGYILYPYRSSAIKNRQRWTFGGIFPLAFAEHAGSDPWTMQTQCLVRGGDPFVDVKVRFLHAVEREVGALTEPAAELPAGGEPAFVPMASLEVDGRRFVAWQEAVEREVSVSGFAAQEWLNGAARIPFAFAGMRQIEPVRRADGRVAAVLRRTARALAGELTLAAEPVAPGVFRLTARIENLTPCEPADLADRHLSQRLAFSSTHTILAVRQGAFVSLMDPPDDLRAAAAGCENQGTWPVLVGAAGAGDLLLSSPIILYDDPQIAPESPGDFFDGTEIDEMLTLRILTLTDREKREMAATDPRARALLERTEAMAPEELARLHGALRRPRAVDGGGSWAAVDDKPRLASLVIGGAELTVGDRVRLDPKGRADIMDLVLKGRIAVIEAIECDFEDRVHLAVTVADDPGRELGLGHMPGHRFFFGCDEVQPLPAGQTE